jgi:hypothetical protein
VLIVWHCPQQDASLLGSLPLVFVSLRAASLFGGTALTNLLPWISILI